MKYVWTLLAALFVGVSVAFAGEPVRVVDARFEPAEVLVGDHLDLVLEVDAAEGSEVAFPEITSEFADGYLELLDEGEVIQRAGTERGRVSLRKRYRLIAFEVGEFRLDSLGVLYGAEGVTDTAFVDAPATLLVQTIPADTTQTTIYGIKGPMDTPVMLEEFGGYALYGLFGLAVLASLIYMFTRLKRREQEERVVLPVEPAHIVAIRALEELHNRKLWQNDRFKEYYTALSDILREYLDGRYGLSAMEMTTDEIMVAIGGLSLNERQCGEVSDVLRECDLVKFAKYIPDADSPEALYYKTYYFVEESKEVAEEFVGMDDKELDIES